MFKLARGIARHKIGFIALITFAVVMFSGGEDENAKPSSPWSKGAAVQASASPSSTDDGSVTGKLGEYANTAGEFSAEKFLGDKDLNPVKLGEDTVGRFDEANTAFAKANGNEQ